ncbi:L,D-transpeptidase family protein [Pikeienuella piscinae]|uniref:L,D-transpeptidase family protein n=1 Tax=Pikeienuella piscinae TaxID=2748098 RepID=A0A7L5BW36_9RHOB|nr:L,D-transpeptidase family protein [Pikeienuella piscinae]QIE54747.1 L,D-transpeptidase family protein [Pikeienuella piscinae]
MQTGIRNCSVGATVSRNSHNMRVIVAAAIFFGISPFSAAAVGQSETTASAVGPHGAALKLALAGSGGAEGAAQDHYQDTAYRGLWIGPAGDDQRARALLAALESAGAHGLPDGKYHTGALRAAVDAAAGGDSALVAVAELALTRAFLTYADDLSYGVLEPGAVDRDIHVTPPVLDEALLLDRVAAAGALEPVLRTLAPAHPDYARLVDLLARLRALTPDAWGAPTPGGASIRPGESGPRVAAARARLVALGDHVEDPEAAALHDPAIYDQALVSSVRAFQRRHGLNDDGVIGARTLEAMNAGIDERIGQVEVNLERLRWVNRPLGKRHIEVNQADFTVRLIDDGATLFAERVVVGSRRHRTPEFSDEMTHLVFNPVWHVPRSIASKEILPALQEDPEYLSKKNMRLVSRDGYQTPDPAFTDWTLYSAADFPFAVKQNPGGGNALGRVKFMFPNRWSIYLHDTPSKRLFAKDARAFSHGCIRVQDPMRLAMALLELQEPNPDALIDRVLASGRETTVRLDTPVPVHLGYRTAWVDDEGRAQFRGDIYGRDARVLAALRAAGVAQ